MRARILAVLTLLVLIVSYRFAGRFERAAPSADLRDAVGSSPVYEALAESAPAVTAAVPTPGVVPDPKDAFFHCGPDITVPLSVIVRKITTAYNSWTPQERAANCAALDVDAKLSATIKGFDIEDLRPNLGYRSVIADAIYNPGDCMLTAAVDGKCYRTEEINYVMWGLMTRLCDKSPAWANIKARAYLLYYYTLSTKRPKWDRSYPGETANKIAWTDAGYNGWPTSPVRKIEAPAPTRSECRPSRFAPYDGSTVFQAHWSDSRIK